MDVSVESTTAADNSSGDEGESCPICLLKLRAQNLGRPAPCQHIFCLTCIREWAKVHLSLNFMIASLVPSINYFVTLPSV